MQPPPNKKRRTDDPPDPPVPVQAPPVPVQASAWGLGGVFRRHVSNVGEYIRNKSLSGLNSVAGYFRQPQINEPSGYQLSSHRHRPAPRPDPDEVIAEDDDWFVTTPNPDVLAREAEAAARARVARAAARAGAARAAARAAEAEAAARAAEAKAAARAAARAAAGAAAGPDDECFICKGGPADDDEALGYIISDSNNVHGHHPKIHKSCLEQSGPRCPLCRADNVVWGLQRPAQGGKSRKMKSRTKSRTKSKPRRLRRSRNKSRKPRKAVRSMRTRGGRAAI